MTEKEMAKRLAELTPEQIEKVNWHIKQGFGAQGIRIETGLSIRLINAVFQAAH